MGLRPVKREKFNWDSARLFISGSPPPISAAPDRSAILTAFAARAGYEVVGVFKETGSGAKLDRTERKEGVWRWRSDAKSTSYW